MDREHGKWRWFFSLAALEAGAAFVALAWLPHEGNAISAARALMLAILAGFFIVGIRLAYRPPHWLEVLPQPSIILSTGVLSLVLAAALFLLRYLDPPVLLPFYRRLEPLLWYVLILSLEASAFLLALKYGLHPAALAARRGGLRPTAIALSVLALAVILVASTRIGLAQDSAYWGEPGVPILGWQLALAVIAGLGILIAGLRFRMPPRIDLFIGLGVWLLAVLVWLTVPTSATRNSFYAPITPPSNQPFPNSDAGYYDSMAESLLIGQPYQGEIPTRPLYILVLTVLHLAAGEDYGLIIVGQTLLLALIPVVLYALGTALHSRAAGVIAALFAIFREWMTMLVSSQTRVSDSRTLLVDLPTLLLVLLACLLAVRWLARRDLRSGLLAGGVFGLLLLLRTQSLLIVPFLLVIVIVSLGVRNWHWISPLVLFCAALLVAVIPWLVHNFLLTGRLAFDAPFQYQIIASQYQYTGNLDINNVDLQGKSVLGILITFLLRDPGFVLGFIATHFLATQINGLLALPLIQPYAGLSQPINLYWLDWNGRLDPANLGLLFGYLIVIAVGLGSAWRRLRWAGLMPLVFSLAYALANGIGRFSGWRYDLPADWISYFYFVIGVAEILTALALVLGAAEARLVTSHASASPATLNPRSAFPIFIGFVLLGALPWLAEGLSSPRYVNQDQPHLVAEVAASPSVAESGMTVSQLTSFAASPFAVVQSGRLLYPRFFSRNLGLASAHPWPAYAPRDFPRLGFLLLNQTRHDVVFPTRQLGGPFPQAADVIVLGCQRGDYIEARLAFFPFSDTVYSNAPIDQPCQ